MLVFIHFIVKSVNYCTCTVYRTVVLKRFINDYCKLRSTELYFMYHQYFLLIFVIEKRDKGLN